ncbi:MAG: hypothetical protein ABEH78_05790 [Haloferacaceae archaeon]
MEAEDDDLPPETVVESGTEWRREEIDEDSYKWVREMEPDEFDWDVDDVSLSTEAPVRVVSVQSIRGNWWVEGAETAGPEHSRSGFPAAISDEFCASCTDAETAFETVREYIERLS